jgi:hypothetical protein
VGRILAVGPGGRAVRTARRCRSAAVRHADHQSADRCVAAE